MDVGDIAALAQDEIDKETANSPAVRKMMKIVQEFIETHRVMCYGGTAINNLLPEKDQFYDFSVEIPDYDFFSETPQVHAAKLGDRLASAGFASVEVKPGIHLGTFKVFADYVPVADVSHMDRAVFKKLWEQSIVKDKIRYTPPNYLRMNMYLELSRPKGDVSRWVKVYGRLQLLNRAYPMTCPKEETKMVEKFMDENTRNHVRSILVKEGAMLLGFNASMVHDNEKTPKWFFPVDVLATPEKRKDLAETFKTYFGEGVKSRDYPEYAELLPARTDITDPKTGTLLVRIYETTACHSYHETNGLLVASIPTLLQFFFGVLYSSKEFAESIPEQRFLCTAEHLVNLANKHTSKRHKILTPITCLGKQKSLVDMRAEKSEIFQKLSRNKNSREFLEYFFQYTPTSNSKTERQKIRKSLKKTLRR
jgi:hypothetical protein